LSGTPLTFLQKIKATLPTQWFGEETPILDSVLNAVSAGWLGQFDLLSYTRAQTRISTAFGAWLDLIAMDYFGYRVKRRLWETDVAFRGRIRTELLRDRCTRLAIYDLLRDLTGRVPIIFEPTVPSDTGSYGSATSGEAGTIGYGISGGWGNLSLPFQVFVRAFRPVTLGVAMVNGWGSSFGGFGTGQSAYIDMAMNSVQVSDSELYQDVCGTAPAGTIVWMAIEP
jgi:hypothetical protein